LKLMSKKSGFDKPDLLVGRFGLPGAFHVRKEGERIIIFKEGYEGLMGEGPPEVEKRLEADSTDEHTEAGPIKTLVRSESAKKGMPAPGAGMYAFGEPKARVVQGRGEYPCLPVEGGGRVIVRRVRHGGLWGKVMGDVLWGADRPIRELINSNKCLERGVPTAEILGLRLELALGGFVPLFRVALPLLRAEVFLRELTGAVDLVRLLDTTGGFQPQKRGIIWAVAESVKAMHEGGLYHNDLHLKNILIAQSSPGEPLRAYIIDLDKSRLYNGALPLSQRIKNLIRLDRSVEKFMASRGCFGLITQRDKLRFLRDYAGGGQSGMDWKGLARGSYARHTLHRWWWKVLALAGVDAYRLTRNRRAV
jgi:hypothetical protein